jgi:hypothetical protein
MDTLDAFLLAADIMFVVGIGFNIASILITIRDMLRTRRNNRA